VRGQLLVHADAELLQHICELRLRRRKKHAQLQAGASLWPPLTNAIQLLRAGVVLEVLEHHLPVQLGVSAIIHPPNQVLTDKMDKPNMIVATQPAHRIRANSSECDDGHESGGKVVGKCRRRVGWVEHCRMIQICCKYEHNNKPLVSSDVSSGLITSSAEEKRTDGELELAIHDCPYDVAP
jgi:hypothetical protein